MRKHTCASIREIMDEIEHKVRVAYGLIKEEAPEGTEETAAVPETEGDDE